MIKVEVFEKPACTGEEVKYISSSGFVTFPKNSSTDDHAVFSTVCNAILCPLDFKASTKERQSLSSPPKKFRDKCEIAISMRSSSAQRMEVHFINHCIDIDISLTQGIKTWI
jgi:hypothetical protein